METIVKTEEQKISLNELKNVLKTMLSYKRKAGFMAHDNNGTLCFFDAEPINGGAYVTVEDLNNYINEY